MRSRAASIGLVAGLIPALWFAPDAFAQTVVSEAMGELLCEFGPTNRDVLFALGATCVVTLVAGVILVSTMARSLAGSGFRQSSANAAAFGLAAMLGGASGATMMAVGDCGVKNMPGGVSLTCGVLGMVLLFFALMTGKR